MSEGFLEGLLKDYGKDKSAILPVLQAIQSRYAYLPKDIIKKYASLSGIAENYIYSVASFYASFRFKEAGKHSIKICVGAACHIKGAPDLYDAFARRLNLKEGEDTDASKSFTLSKVACLGCCMLAPAVLIDNTIYGWVEPKRIDSILDSFLSSSNTKGGSDLALDGNFDGQIRMCLCSSCVAGSADKIYNKIKSEIAKYRYKIDLREVSCKGSSYRVPMFEILTDNGLVFDYSGVSEFDVEKILRTHFKSKGFNKIKLGLRKLVDNIYTGDKSSCNCGNDEEFFSKQKRLTTKNAGEFSPLDLDSYIANDGFKALEKSRDMGADWVLEQLRDSGLRGRGGGGFPTFKKWEMLRLRGAIRYLICNADEGDPGAFMDRMLIESFPFRVLEGIFIAAESLKVTGVIIYIRQEYIKAIEILESALEKSKNIFSDKFFVRIFKGAGAFVCGEETALIASLHGARGEPMLRPPYPVDSGFQQLPTIINNVETYANLPWIILNTGEAFAKIGTFNSKGTKTFALAGKIKKGGLIEVPLGMSLREILYDIGGGSQGNKKLKAVQIGGPSGGCIPESLFDMKVDYEEIQRSGAIMGSGGLVVLDESDCMVDLCAYFLEFVIDESCGKCTACRVGTSKMLEIIKKIQQGKGRLSDLDELETLGNFIKTASLCGLGKTAPNPLLSCLRYFKDEFIEHINGVCRAGKCKELSTYIINDKCIGCTKCVQACASQAIEFEPFKKHSIDEEKCTRCGVCRDICPVDAVELKL